MHRVPRIWLMVADRHRVRVFSKKNDGVSLIAEIAPQRQAEIGMANMSVSAGRGAVRLLSVAHAKHEHHTNESHKDESSFAHEIAVWLDAEAGKGSFDRLVLAAAPHMLGELRKTIKRAVYTRIIAEIHKDLTKMKDAELQCELEKILWF